MSHYECKKCHKRYDYCTCGQEKTSFKVGDKVIRNEKIRFLGINTAKKLVLTLIAL